MSKFFVANFKANKTISEAEDWAKQVKTSLENSQDQIIVCPNFVCLEAIKTALAGSSIKVGSQDVSAFPVGAYTGEVSAQILASSVEYSIVGHSERKKYFGETEEMISKKVANLIESGITPILCVADLNQLGSYLNDYSAIKEGKEKIIFVYEPPSAISGGGDFHPENAQTAAKIISEFKTQIGLETKVLYGGSVNSGMLASFLAKEVINGFLIGKASLDPQEFVKLVSQASGSSV